MSLQEPKTIYIDSDLRESGTHGKFNYKITLEKPNLYDSVSLDTITLPKSFYLINAPNNTLILDENKTETIITIPEGNYTYRTFASVLSNLLNSNGTYTYNINIPDQTTAQTGKYTFIVSENGGIQPSLIFPSSSRLYKQAGFNKNSINTFVGDILTSLNMVQMTLNTIQIKTNLIKPSKNGMSEDILAIIPVNTTPDFSVISYQNKNIYATAKQYNNNHSSYKFLFTDEDENIINFNGVSCNFSLVFSKFDDSAGHIKRYLFTKWYESEMKNIVASNS